MIHRNDAEKHTHIKDEKVWKNYIVISPFYAGENTTIMKINLVAH